MPLALAYLQTLDQLLLTLGPWEVQLQSATCCQAAQGAKAGMAANIPGNVILANTRPNIRQNDKQKQPLLTLGPWEVLLESATCCQAAQGAKVSTATNVPGITLG
jgi:hypothetical protein